MSRFNNVHEVLDFISSKIKKNVSKCIATDKKGCR